MKKMTTNKTEKLVQVYGLLLASAGLSVAVADDNNYDSNKNGRDDQASTHTIVTKQTPDEVLLQGKSTAMFEVAQPSESLTIAVNNTKYPVKVVKTGDEKVLKIEGIEESNIEVLEEVYASITDDGVIESIDN